MMKKLIWPKHLKVLYQEPLNQYSYVGLGGPARYMAFPQHKEDISLLLKLCERYQLPWFVLGKGSNVLFADNGFPGMVIVLKSMHSKVYVRDQQLHLFGELPIERLVHEFYQAGFAGADRLIGVPGMSLASIITNAGTSQGAMCDLVHKIYYFDSQGRGCELTREQIIRRTAYRQGPLRPAEGIIYGAVFRVI